ncbi:MAG: hypothetical protein LBU23_04135 [Planctomycetota bacterium]|jgi:shikimate kinase|nr:hypothetical protein [Planctomycetota bacterium]
MKMSRRLFCGEIHIPALPPFLPNALMPRGGAETILAPRRLDVDNAPVAAGGEYVPQTAWRAPSRACGQAWTGGGRGVIKVFLIGIPGCGKSTLGKRAAEALGLPFHDTDVMGQQKAGRIRPFSFYWQQRFLLAQRDAIEELSALDASAIVATGAEVPFIGDCAGMMRRAGTIIHIQKSPESILEELERNGTNKFVLQNMTTGKTIAINGQAVQLYSKEIEQYEALADVALLNDGDEDAGARKLVALITKLSQYTGAR